MTLLNLNSVYEGGGYKSAGVKRYDGDFKEQHVVRPGDVIVTNTEQGHERRLIGFAALVPERIAQPALFSHHLFRVRTHADSGLSNDFICRWLNTSSAHDVVSGYANGTTVNMLPIDGLQSPLLCVPPKDLCAHVTSLSESSRHKQERDRKSTRLNSSH